MKHPMGEVLEDDAGPFQSSWDQCLGRGDDVFADPPRELSRSTKKQLMLGLNLLVLDGCHSGSKHVKTCQNRIPA